MVKRQQYPESATEEALKPARGEMSIKKAAKEHKVSRITLLNKYNGKYPEVRKIGPWCILTDLDEKRIENWLNEMARACSFLSLLSLSTRTGLFTGERKVHHDVQCYISYY